MIATPSISRICDGVSRNPITFWDEMLTPEFDWFDQPNSFGQIVGFVTGFLENPWNFCMPSQMILATNHDLTSRAKSTKEFSAQTPLIEKKLVLVDHFCCKVWCHLLLHPEPATAYVVQQHLLFIGQLRLFLRE